MCEDRVKGSSTLDSYRDLLLGGKPTLSARQIVEREEVELDQFEEYWLATGFPFEDPDVVAYTERDAEAFGVWVGMVRNQGLGAGAAVSLVRAQSHLADRLSLWQFEALVEDNERKLGLDDTSARLVAIDELEEYVAFFEEQLLYSWRLQMQGLIERIGHDVAQRPADHSRRRFPLTRTLGFVDMVSFTVNSSILGDALVDLIERFEYVCRSAVAQKGGRVVKMIGDSVFFIADSLEVGVSVATHLMETLKTTENILPVRASLVQGDVFSRSGDVFGPPVNLAARLVDVAPPGRILTDAPTAAAVEAGHAGDGYYVASFPRTELRGFGRVSPFIIGSDSDKE